MILLNTDSMRILQFLIYARENKFSLEYTGINFIILQEELSSRGLGNAIERLNLCCTGI